MSVFLNNGKCMKSYLSILCLAINFNYQLSIFFFIQVKSLKINFFCPSVPPLIWQLPPGVKRAQLYNGPYFHISIITFSVWKTFSWDGMGIKWRCCSNPKESAFLLPFEMRGHFCLEKDSENTSSMSWDRPRRNCLHRTRGILLGEKFNHCAHIIHPAVAPKKCILHVVTKIYKIHRHYDVLLHN